MSAACADLNLRFRQYASENNTDGMISLITTNRDRININATGTESKQTAAHRAAKNGHAAALKLLFNLNADFNVPDKNGHLPSQLAKDNHTKLIFTLIDDSKRALHARKLFYPRTVNDSDLEHEQRVRHQIARNVITERGNEESLVSEFIQLASSVNERCHAELQRPLYLRIVPIFEQCIECLLHFERGVIVLEEAIRQDMDISACGESVTASFAYLTCDRKVDYPVEGINIMNYLNEGHACLLLNRKRDISMQVNQLTSWQDALLIDPLNERIFFYQFVEYCSHDTCIKQVSAYNILPFITNWFPTIPDEPPQLASFKIAFTSRVEQLCQSMLSLFRQRCPEQTSNQTLPLAAAAAPPDQNMLS